MGDLRDQFDIILYTEFKQIFMIPAYVPAIDGFIEVVVQVFETLGESVHYSDWINRHLAGVSHIDIESVVIEGTAARGIGGLGDGDVCTGFQDLDRVFYDHLTLRTIRSAYVQVDCVRQTKKQV